MCFDVRNTKKRISNIFKSSFIKTNASCLTLIEYKRVKIHNITCILFIITRFIKKDNIKYFQHLFGQ